MMKLVDVDALRSQWKVAERCEDCKRDARYCDGSLYGSEMYSARDICGKLDEAPLIEAIPTDWIEEKIKLMKQDCESKEAQTIQSLVYWWKVEQYGWR